MAPRIVFASVLFLAALPLSCGYSEPKAPEGGEDKPADESSKSDAPSATESPPSTSESTPGASNDAVPDRAASGACDDRACTSTEDCCKGFACGFDPERSRVQRYCQPQ
jgi:hypothetical protein